MTSRPSLVAGAAPADITPGVGVAMGGYGARQGVASGIHDPLLARAIVLSDGATTLALVVCDLVFATGDLVSQVRTLAADELGLMPNQVCVSATHTHSGPAGIRSKDAAADVAVMARKVAGAIRMAMARLTPVTLKATQVGLTSIAQNRRHPDGPIEAFATVLLAAPPAPASPVATVVNYACHATVLEHDNLEYSGDFPGQATRAIEDAVGGTAIYLQGCAGDINPVWMRHDHDEVRRVGGILAGAAARAVHELRAVGEGQWAVNLSWSEETPKPPSGEQIEPAPLGAATVVVDLPRRALPTQEDAAVRIRALEAQLADPGAAPTVRRTLLEELNRVRMEWVFAGARRPAAGQTRPVEIQAFRLGRRAAMVALPGEFFVEIGAEIRDRCGLDVLLLAGYANGTVGYVPTAEAFPHGGYEVGCAQFEPSAAATVVDATVALVAGLMGEEEHPG